MLKYFDRQQVQSALHGFLANGLNNNQLIYNKAEKELGNNVFINSYPSYIERYDNHVDVQIATPVGVKTIRAKKLLLSIQPSLIANLNFMDLDRNENLLLGQFNNSYYWDAIVKNSGIPDNTSLNAADPDAPLRVPSMPGLSVLSTSPFPGIHLAYYGSAHFMTNADVKKAILTSIDAARRGLGYAASSEEPQVIELHAHLPFVATVSTEAVENGFYRELQALQGKKNTFYTGAAWNVQSSSNLWEFNDNIILPRILKALG